MTPADPTKQMMAVFEKYRHKYEPYKLFERFMEFVIAGFDITFSTIERPFSSEEAEPCAEMLNAWVMSMNDILKSKEWYDILGDIYMNYIAGTMTKQWSGQFFTPMHICDFMAKITEPGENVGESVMDSACGSGRMLLAAHIIHPGNYCCAQDMDRICCLMTVCNFIIHGVRGEVVWGNSLDPLDYRAGWKVNETLNLVGIPGVRKMDKMEAISYRNGLKMMEEISPEKDKTTPPGSVNTSHSPKKKESDEPIQLSLF